jgi:uncharacterized membrane protein
MQITLFMATIVLAWAAGSYAQAPSVTIRDLGTIVPDQNALAVAVNGQGHVVGFSAPRDAESVANSTAFLWTPEFGVELFLGGVSGQARDINDVGQIVGDYSPADSDGIPRGFLWSREHGLTELEGFNAYSINELGQVGGRCRDTAEACLWESGTITRLRPAGVGVSVNELGQVAVCCGPAEYWAPVQGMTVLDAGDFSRANDINDSAQVVGVVQVGLVSATVVFGATIWHEGLATGVPGVRRVSIASAINNRGWVVGSHADHPECCYDAFLWIPGTEPIDLPSVRGTPDGHHALAMNERGDIAGTSNDSLGYQHAIIWTIRDNRLAITTPNTPSDWGLDTRHRIAWTYTGTASQLTIEISRAGDENWELIEIVARRGGRSQNYYWTVTGPTSENARLRVTAVGEPDATDINNADIRIAPASIEVLRPRSRTSAQFNSMETIFFRHNLGASAPVAIDVSQDGGRNWRTLTPTQTKGSTTSTVRWNVDIPATSRARVRIRALDGSAAVGISDVFAVGSGGEPTVDMEVIGAFRGMGTRLAPASFGRAHSIKAR